MFPCFCCFPCSNLLLLTSFFSPFAWFSFCCHLLLNLPSCVVLTDLPTCSLACWPAQPPTLLQCLHLSGLHSWLHLSSSSSHISPAATPLSFPSCFSTAVLYFSTFLSLLSLFPINCGSTTTSFPLLCLPIPSLILLQWLQSSLYSLLS